MRPPLKERKFGFSSKILEMRRDIATTIEGAYYTLSSLPLTPDLRILDLGCGDGVFLEAAASILVESGMTTDSAASTLTGVEKDFISAKLARQRLSLKFGVPPENWDIRVEDALWFTPGHTFDRVIGNPPWVRLHDIATTTRNRARMEFQTAKGAYDLCYLMIEKGLSLLRDGGEMAVICPAGIACQPAAAPLRDLLDETGSWSLEPIDKRWLASDAGIDPAILRVKRSYGESRLATSKSPRVLSDLAQVCTGVATGADKVFSISAQAIEFSDLEPEWVKPVVKGRDLKPGNQLPLRDMSVIFPYSRTAGRWALRDISQASGVFKHLGEFRSALEKRPRLQNIIARHPSTWYRFIALDVRPDDGKARLILPDVFREPQVFELNEDEAVVLNTCFEIFPLPGRQEEVLSYLRRGRFSAWLRGHSRHLANGYQRTSATELRSAPLD